MPPAPAIKVVLRRIDWLCKRTKEYEANTGYVAAVFRREIAAFQAAAAALGHPVAEIPKAPWRSPDLLPQRPRIEMIL